MKNLTFVANKVANVLITKRGIANYKACFGYLVNVLVN